MKTTLRERRVVERYRKSFYKTRSVFKRHNSVELILQILYYLYEDFQLGHPNHLRKLPWVQVLLIKWILADKSFNLNGASPSQDDALRCMNLARECAMKARMPDEFAANSLFFMAISFQQLSYQEGFSLQRVSRTKLIFADLESNHRLTKQFEKLFGITVLEFLELSIAISAKYISNPTPQFVSSFFSTLEPEFSSDAIKKFLNAISIDADTLRRHLAQLCPDTRQPKEAFEVSPLQEFPLLGVNGKYLCWYPTILFRCLESFVYDSLKRQDPQRFMDTFGDIFERYVRHALEESKAKVFSESELQQFLRGEKCVDFAIHEEGSLVLIDAKGVELATKAIATHRPGDIKSATKANVLKAIGQAESVYNNLSKLAPLIGEKADLIPYVIVVTYKEHFLSNGSRFFETLSADVQTAHSIPHENIYFLSIDDLDFLAEAVRQGRKTFSGMLELAKGDDAKPATSKLIFEQHLRAHGLTATPARLTSALEALTERMEKALAD